jgi:hypothetical protein
MNRILFFILLSLSTKVLSAQNVWLAHYFDTIPCFECVDAYTWVDNATLRAKPGKDAKAIARLPIGSGCKILKESQDTLDINGIESVWYKVQTDSGQGWIWGGLMTRWFAGSQTDVDVKFFVGYEQFSSYNPNDTNSRQVTWMQIRAVRNHKEIAKYRFEVWEPLWNVSNTGNRGLSMFKDVIAVEESGESCGHFSGAVWLFWDGTQFLDQLVIGGVADGEFSVWDTPIFPSDIRGQRDMLILSGEDYIDYFEPNAEYPRAITERIGRRRELYWQEGKWHENKASIKTQTLYYMLNDYNGDTLYLPEQLPEEYRDWINWSKGNQK